MAYARFGSHSDIYVFESGYGIVCQRCKSHKARDFVAKSRSEMLEHMQTHRDVGDNVPEDAFERLRSDQAAKGDVIKT
jgi:hypothetical protein